LTCSVYNSTLQEVEHIRESSPLVGLSIGIGSGGGQGEK
jgi:hypothetical protein